MPKLASQRAVLGIGLAILLVISAASIGLDVKSRSDAAWVDHTLEVLQKLSDMRLLLSRAESAARAYVLTNDQTFVKEFSETRDQIGPALADLIETTRDNRVQTQLLENSRELIARRLAVSAELLRLQAAGDTAGIAAMNAKAEGRTVMSTISADFDKVTSEEQRLLAIRTSDSRQTRFILPPTSVKSPSRTGLQSGHPAWQPRSIRNYQRLSALTDQAKTIPRQGRCRAKSP